jgi:hypothetical protein
MWADARVGVNVGHGFAEASAAAGILAVPGGGVAGIAGPPGAAAAGGDPSVGTPRGGVEIADGDRDVPPDSGVITDFGKGS